LPGDQGGPPPPDGKKPPGDQGGPPPPDDTIRGAANHDSDAFGDLYRIYMPKIHRYIAYQVNDRVLAEDLTNEVFLRVMRAIGRYQHHSVPQFNAWIFRIAKNVVIDHWRAKRDTVPLDEALATERGETLDAHFESLARREELQVAMQKLTEDQREVLVLRFGMGMSHREIAEQTGRNEEAIRALQFRAIRSLRAIMGEDTD